MTVAVALAVRYLLVVLFFPFSALDKMINFKGAVGQAKEMVPGTAAGHGTDRAGTGGRDPDADGHPDRRGGPARGLHHGRVLRRDRAAVEALVDAGRLLAGGDSKARDLFWDFLKNFSLAGGFLLLAFGLHSGDIDAFLAAPLASSHPYAHPAP